MELTFITHNTTNAEIVDLSHRYIGDIGCRELHEAKLKNVRVLNLIYNYISDAGVKHLAESHWPNVTHLYLEWNTIGAQGCRSLIEGSWTKLEVLDLGACKIGVNGAEALKSGGWKALKTISLYNNALYEEGAAHIAEAEWDDLRAINLNYNNINDNGCEHLSNAKWPELQAIHLGGNQISSHGIYALSTGNWKKIKVLDLFINGLGNEGCRHLKNGPWKNLMTLNVWKNNIGNKGCKFLRHAEWYHVKNVNLCQNKISDGGALWLSKTHWPKLQILHLGTNLITNNGCKCLKKGGWPILISLDLGRNRIQQEGLNQLLFGTYTNLQKLVLCQFCLRQMETKSRKSIESIPINSCRRSNYLCDFVSNPCPVHFHLSNKLKLNINLIIYLAIDQYLLVKKMSTFKFPFEMQVTSDFHQQLEAFFKLFAFQRVSRDLSRAEWNKNGSGIIYLRDIIAFIKTSSEKIQDLHQIFQTVSQIMIDAKLIQSKNRTISKDFIFHLSKFANYINNLNTAQSQQKEITKILQSILSSQIKSNFYQIEYEINKSILAQEDKKVLNDVLVLQLSCQEQESIAGSQRRTLCSQLARLFSDIKIFGIRKVANSKLNISADQEFLTALQKYLEYSERHFIDVTNPEEPFKKFLACFSNASIQEASQKYELLPSEQKYISYQLLKFVRQLRERIKRLEDNHVRSPNKVVIHEGSEQILRKKIEEQDADLKQIRKESQNLRLIVQDLNSQLNVNNTVQNGKRLKCMLDSLKQIAAANPAEVTALQQQIFAEANLMQTDKNLLYQIAEIKSIPQHHPPSKSSEDEILSLKSKHTLQIQQIEGKRLSLENEMRSANITIKDLLAQNAQLKSQMKDFNNPRTMANSKEIQTLRKKLANSQQSQNQSYQQIKKMQLSINQLKAKVEKMESQLKQRNKENTVPKINLQSLDHESKIKQLRINQRKLNQNYLSLQRSYEAEKEECKTLSMKLSQCIAESTLKQQEFETALKKKNEQILSKSEIHLKNAASEPSLLSTQLSTSSASDLRFELSKLRDELSMKDTTIQAISERYLAAVRSKESRIATLELEIVKLQRSA